MKMKLRKMLQASNNLGFAGIKRHKVANDPADLTKSIQRRERARLNNLARITAERPIVLIKRPK